MGVYLSFLHIFLRGIPSLHHAILHKARSHSALCPNSYKTIDEQNRFSLLLLLRPDVESKGMVASPIIVAYYAAWSIYSRAFFVSDIPAAKITHINYAFANIAADGCIALGDSWADVEKSFPGDTWNQPVRGNFNQLLQLKEKHPHLRTLISVGGWVTSSVIVVQRQYYDMCLDVVKRILGRGSHAG